MWITILFLALAGKSFGSEGTMADEKTALILIADGSEEMEAVISIDVLRRAGVKAVVAAVGGSGLVRCSNGVNIGGDISFAEAKSLGPFDAIVLPGGMGGAKTFAADAGVLQLVKEQFEANRIVAAICASPAIVLPAAQIAEGRKVTCYPSLETHFGDKYSYISDQKVVTDGNLITSQGPGTAFDFGLEISSVLMGKEKAESVKKALLL